MCFLVSFMEEVILVYLKRFIALFLTVAMLFSMTAIFVQAADSEEGALKDISIYNSGESLSCLAVSGRVQTLNYVYYKFEDRHGQIKEIPTYCVNPTTDGVPQKVKPGESIDYIIGKRASDPRIMGIVANGYPTKGLGELGLKDKYEGYYATKIALWCHIIPKWSITQVSINPSLSGEQRTQAERVLAAAKKIDPVYEEAARTLGAPSWRIMRDVTLPALLPALVSTGAICFATSMGAFGTAFTLATDINVLPITIYTEFTLSANIASAAMLSVVLGVITWVMLLAARRASRLGTDPI